MIKKAYPVSEILPGVIREIVQNSIEYDRLNGPIERDKLKEMARIAARKKCLDKVKNL